VNPKAKPGYKTVCVVGLGYVGLPTAAILASRGVKVFGVDTNAEAVALINQGKVHIVEPDLDIVVNAVVATRNLEASSQPQPADAFIIAVPTPFTDGHKPDLTFVRAAAKSVASVLKAGDLVVVESTSPVGTAEMVSRLMADLRPELTFPHDAAEQADVCVAYSPERVLPGRVLAELVRNDRVIGGVSRRCAERAADLYRIFVDGECLLTDARTAELVKLAENSYRDVNIAFANELSLVCDHLDIDVWNVVALANRHPRVDILKPGPGVGGHCIAVDPWFIVDSAPQATDLIRAARKVNDDKPHHVAARILTAAKDFSSPRVACLGLSYKPDIDDLRESPAVDIVAGLARDLDGELLVVEPHVEDLPPALAGHGRLRHVDLDEALAAADIVVLLVDHQAFKTLDRERLAGKIIIDTRGVWR
jgi:UDP-N-acetyl-D-mannosaminuronic acid dehydrogenase